MKLNNNLLKNVLLIILMLSGIIHIEAKNDRVVVNPIDLDTVSCDFLNVYIKNVFEYSLMNDKYIQGIAEKLATTAKKQECLVHPSALNLLGFKKYVQNDIIGAREILLEAENIFKDQGLVHDINYFRNQTFLGLTYNLQKDYGNAILYFTRAEEISSKINNEKCKVEALSNLGLVNLEMGNWAIAKDFLLQSKTLSEAGEHYTNLAFVLHNLTRVFIETGDNKAAIDYSNQSEAIWKNRKDTVGLYYNAHLQANIYTKQKDWNMVVKYLEKAIEFSEAGIVSHLNGEIFIDLAEVYDILNRKEEVQLNYEKALAFGEGLAQDSLNTIIGKLIASYKQENKVDKLAELYNKILLIESKKERLKQLENKKWMNNEIALEKAALKNKELQLSMAFDQEKMNLKNRYILFLGIATLISVLIGFSTYQQYQQKKKLVYQVRDQNERLVEINQELSVSSKIIADQNQMLEMQNADLQNFAYVVAHDLKAPARTIASFSGLLRKRIINDISSDALSLLNTIERGGRNMFQLVNDLLAFSKLGTNQLNFDLVDPNEIIKSVFLDLATDIEEKKAEIVLNKLPAKITADRIKLRLVFQNLINNALKFTKKDGKPYVEIAYEDGLSHHTFFIKDNGIGIPVENQTQIFNMFTKLHGPSFYEGTGIGLATCMKIVKLHDGTIQVDSKEDEGSVFRFSIAKTLNA